MISNMSSEPKRNATQTDRVLISGADKRDARIYHTDFRCLHAPENGSKVQLKHLGEGWRECKYCADDYDRNHDPDFSTYEAAKAWGESE